MVKQKIIRFSLFHKSSQYYLYTILICLSILLLTPIHLNAANSWLDKLHGGGKHPVGEYKITPEDLDGMIYAFADSYMSKIVSATRDITLHTTDAEQRRNAMLLRVGSVNSIYDIATNPDPFTKLLDMLLVVTLQSYVWIDEDRAEKLFADSARKLIDAMHQNRLEIWKLAAKVMKPEQLYVLDWLIIDWRRQNPDVNFVIFPALPMFPHLVENHWSLMYKPVPDFWPLLTKPKKSWMRPASWPNALSFTPNGLPCFTPGRRKA